MNPSRNIYQSFPLLDFVSYNEGNDTQNNDLNFILQYYFIFIDLLYIYILILNAVFRSDSFLSITSCYHIYNMAVIYFVLILVYRLMFNHELYGLFKICRVLIFYCHLGQYVVALRQISVAIYIDNTIIQLKITAQCRRFQEDLNKANNRHADNGCGQ